MINGSPNKKGRTWRALTEAADGLIVGSPGYFASSNGALLSLLDRVFMTGTDLEFKPAAAVASARMAGMTATLEVMNKYFQMSGMPVVPANYCNYGSRPFAGRSRTGSGRASDDADLMAAKSIYDGALKKNIGTIWG